jgi:two-component system heavy metal sensor histidine kinase CusS
VVYAIRPEILRRKAAWPRTQLPDVTPTLWDKGGKQYLGLETTVEALDFWSQADSLAGSGGTRCLASGALSSNRCASACGSTSTLAVIVAALFALFAAHRGLAPLRRVTATARNLSAEHLGERLAERDAPTEVRAIW